MQKICRQMSSKQKLDELLAKVRAQLIEKKGLKEEPIEQPKPADEQTEPTEELPQHPDTDYLIKVFNHLKDLGYINTQYEFSEQFLNKNNYARKNSLGNCFSA